MDGIIFTNSFQGGEADLTNHIASMGMHDAPFYGLIPKAVPSKKAKASLGHTWEYETPVTAGSIDGFDEGSAPAEATVEVLGESKNHYQIFKETYGETGSAEGSERRDGQKSLNVEGTKKSIKQRLSIEKAMFVNAAPVKRVNTGTKVKGKLGGLPHWHTAENSFDAVNEELSIKLLREYFKLHYKKGIGLTHIFVSDIQKDRIDDIYSTLTRVGGGQVAYEAHNIMTLKNFAYAPDVKVVMSEYVPDGDIFGVQMDNLALVHQRLMKTYELGRIDDAVKKEIITELTLRVNHPFATGKLHNLKTA